MNNIILFILRKIEASMTKIGEIINQTPSVEENKRAFFPRMFTIPPQKKMPINPKREKIKLKEVYGHKGSGYKGKGKINREAATFNHPRKGLSPGRKH